MPLAPPPPVSRNRSSSVSAIHAHVEAESQWPTLEPPHRTFADHDLGDVDAEEASEPRQPAFTEEPNHREVNHLGSISAPAVDELELADARTLSRIATLSAGDDDEATDFDDDDFDDEFDDDFEEDDDEFGTDDDVAGDDPGEETEFTSFGDDEDEELPIEPDED